MTKKSPISVDKIQFCDYYLDQVNDLSSMDKFHYDDRRDFINHEFLAGIAVKVEIGNIRFQIDRHDLTLPSCHPTEENQLSKRGLQRRFCSFSR